MLEDISKECYLFQVDALIKINSYNHGFVRKSRQAFIK